MSDANLDASLNGPLHLLDHWTKHLAHRRAEHTLRQIHDAVHGQRTVQRTRDNQTQSETIREPGSHRTIEPFNQVEEYRKGSFGECQCGLRGGLGAYKRARKH